MNYSIEIIIVYSWIISLLCLYILFLGNIFYETINFLTNLLYLIRQLQSQLGMKLMKIYEIEKNYKLHKDRLLCINTTNNRAKTLSRLQSNLTHINNFKRGRVQTEVFNEKERMDKIYTDNMNLHSRMIGLQKREKELLGSKVVPHLSNSKSLRNSTVDLKYQKENIKIRERLLQTKGNYNHLMHAKEKKRVGSNKRHQLRYLLERQLGIKPYVLFPNVRQSQKPSSSSKPKKSRKRIYTQHPTEQLSVAKHKSSFSFNYTSQIKTS